MVQTTNKKKTGTKKTAMMQETFEDAAYTGAYVNRNGADGAGIALISILMSDHTCGMFMMPTSQHVIWMGKTNYKVEGNNIYFTIQSVPDGKGSVRKAGEDDEKYLEAKIELGKRYSQGGNVFDYVTGDIKYWKTKKWDDIGEARELEGPEDFDTAHEIRKIMIASINKFGNDLGW